MKANHFLGIVTLAALTLTSSSSFRSRRDGDTSSCYDYKLSLQDIARAEQFGFEVADGKAVCEILPSIKHSGHLVHVGGVFVSFTSRDGLPHRKPCAYLADSVRFLRDHCGEKGGGAVANHDGNIIVHVEDKWNNQHGPPS